MRNKINKKLIIIIFSMCLIITIMIYLLLTYFSPIAAYHFDHEELEYKEENISIYILPQEKALEEMFEVITNAKSEIHCAFRSLNHKELEELLIEKEKNIKVRLFINSDYKGNKRIYLPFVKFDDENREGMMHNNYCIIDENIVITGSVIFNENTIEKNLHDILIINSKELAKEYNTDFWTLYLGKKEKDKNTTKTQIKINDNTFITPYFCPREDCEGQIIKEINNSKEKILFATYAFTNNNIIDSIKNNTSVKITGLVDYYGLTEFSAPFQKVEGTTINKFVETLHTKLFTFDTETTITGTMNPTYYGANTNEENILIIKSSKINKFYSNFINYLYEKSK